ncbi:hypothetical protein Pst134EB_012907 [Puccinia striiformis f. sp. tritici]|nr:hypothetical protein Pst134EB_012907 [Puccinia striiformis f. sp. tritici]
MTRTPQTQKRNRRKSPSPLISSTDPSNPNTQPPASDDPVFEEQTQVNNPSTIGCCDLTDQEELIRAQRTAENAVSIAYSTYHEPELSDQLDKKRRRMIAYPCKMCGSKINRPMTDSSCSNLLRHQATCLQKQNEAGSAKLACVGVNGTGDIDCTTAMRDLVCRGHPPINALADASHQKILHPTVVKNLPSKKMLSRSVHMLYTAVQDTLRKSLLDHTGVMYIGADAWQSPNGFDILGVLSKSHTSEYRADTIRVVVEKFKIQNQICGIVTDNASNNSAMVLEMKKFKWARFKGDPQWIRCYAHILNLIAQSILRPFGTVKKQSGPQATDMDVDTSSDESDDNEDAEDQICRFENDASHLTHSNDNNDTLQPELTLEDIQDLSEEDEEKDLYTTSMCRKSLAKLLTSFANHPTPSWSL